ncbi:juvenile hormone acid O-methyltransferase [Aricia agestis]|uniref:juvenile hormone acid O-methyltransferase n=1 Tax=Aricia agestis TaxID=91739 RepID=UPI001C202973|nr:juvenile hormone acid O-methyltransferase [Aricia agestis]
MNDAELYQQGNTLQTRDALLCLQEYAPRIRWATADIVVDIGCGDGSVTTKILKKMLPPDHKLVGCDKSDKMVMFANEHYGRDATSFIVLDIENDLPKGLRENFDHAFSFYALHWIKHQKAAFTNIYDLLAEGGDCLLMFLGHMPVYDVFRILAQSNKWRTWLKDVDRFISPYHDCKDSEKEIKRMMTDIGFKDVEVKCSERSFLYESTTAIKKAVAGVNPFEIPKDRVEDFLEDYVAIVKEKYLIDHANNNSTESFSVKTNYQLIIVYGKK